VGPVRLDPLRGHSLQGPLWVDQERESHMGGSDLMPMRIVMDGRSEGERGREKKEGRTGIFGPFHGRFRNEVTEARSMQR